MSGIQIDPVEELLKSIEIVQGRQVADNFRRIVATVRARSERYRVATLEENQERKLAGVWIIGPNNFKASSADTEKLAEELERLNNLNKTLIRKLQEVEKIVKR